MIHTTTAQSLKKYIYFLGFVIALHCTSCWNSPKLGKTAKVTYTNDLLENNLLTEEKRNHIAQQLKQIQFKGEDGKPLDNQSFFRVNNALIESVYTSYSLVFNLKGYPDLIFKVDSNRKVHIIKARKTIQQQQLTHLILPKVEEIAGVLVEEKYPIEDRPELHKDLYRRYYDQFSSNPALKEACRKTFLDMTRFIIDTKLDDVRYDNFPFFKQGENPIKMLLLDLGRMKTNEVSYPGFLSLLWMAHPDFHDDMIKTAASQAGMHPRNFMNALDNMREEKKNNFLNYLQGKKPKIYNLPSEYNYCLTTPITRVTTEQKKALDRYNKAKEWIQAHPSDQALLNKIQRAKQNLPTLLPHNKEAAMVLDAMSQAIDQLKQLIHHHYGPVVPDQRQTLIRTDHVDTQKHILQFLYNQGLTQPDLVHNISLQSNNGTIHMSYFYF